MKLPVQYSCLEAPVALGYLEPAYREESAGLRDWTMRTFAPKQGHDAVQFVHEINTWIYRSIRYRRREDGLQFSPRCECQTMNR